MVQLGGMESEMSESEIPQSILNTTNLGSFLGIEDQKKEGIFDNFGNLVDVN